MNISGISDGAKLKSSYKIAMLQLFETEEFLQNSTVTSIWNWRFLTKLYCYNYLKLKSSYKIVMLQLSDIYRT